MDVLRRGLVSTMLLLLALLAVVGAYEPAQATREAVSYRMRGIYRDTRETNNSTEDSGGKGGAGESEVNWLGRHWYVFVVLLVIIIVVCVFVCGCVVRRSRLGPYNTQVHQNENRYNPRISASNYPPFARAMQPLPYSPQRSSIQTEDASSFTRLTESSFMNSSNSNVGRGSLSVNAPPTAPPTLGASDSPWSFIQSVAKAKGRRGDGDGERGKGRGGGVQSGGGGIEHGSRRSHHHHHHQHHNYHHHHRHHCSPTYLHRQHHSHHRRFSNPQAKVNGITEDSGASLCSLPSTSGSMQSERSNQSSNRSNWSRSNYSSHSHSDNSTVVEVNVNVHLSPDQLDRAKVVTMAALAESVRELAESAADFGREEVHTRSLPHSPPHNSHWHPRHSVTGAPITPHSLPPSTLLDHKRLFQSHSSSHLPPLQAGDSRPASPRTRHTISLDRKNNRYLYPTTLTVVSGCGTEDEGTVVSLDRNSSSSSCHCPSTVAFELGQRPLLTQSPPGMKGATIVSLDQYLNGGTDSEADTTVVSLDRVGPPNAGDHRVRSTNQEPQKTSSNCLGDPSGGHDNCRGCHGDRGTRSHSGNSGNLSVNSNSSFSSSSRTHKSLHTGHDHQRNSTNFQQQMAHLNLDSQIEDTPLIKQPSGNLCSPRTKSSAREDSCILNGYSYHSHIALQSLSHSHPNSSPKLALHQQLQNISEQGESECLHSSDNFEVGDAAARHSDGQERASSLEQLAGPGLLDVVELDMDQHESSVAAKTRDKKRRGRRKRERQSRHKESQGRAGGLEDNVEVITKEETMENTDMEEVLQISAEMSGTKVSSIPLQDRSLHSSSERPHSSVSLQQSLPPLSRSPPLDQAHSPPRSGSALSISEPLSSTASGYAATGESGSTCSVEVKSNGECFPELEDIEKALFDTRSQFSYPLDQELESASLDDNLDLGSSFHQLLPPHSQAIQSHTGSDSDQFQHSVPLTYDSGVHSMQQIQSVDV